MNSHSKAGFAPPDYFPRLESGDNPFQFLWVDHQHELAVVRVMTPSTGTDRKRRSAEAEAVLAWLLDAASGAQVIKSNPRKELVGHHWL